MKKILVPTDFSIHADAAMTVAVSIGLKAGAELFLLHLEHIMNTVPASGSPDNDHIRTNRNKLFRLANETEQLGLKVHTIFVEDQGMDFIDNYIKPYGIDFVVMGSHGQSGLKDYLVGSKTRQLVRKATVPVLVVKSLSSVNLNFPIIIFTSDFRADLSKVMPLLASFADTFISKVRFLYLNMLYHLIAEDEAKNIMEGYSSVFKSHKPFFSIAETNDDYTGITEFMKMRPADLIAVCMEYATFPGRLLNLPLAEKLIQSSDVPVLIFPPPSH